MTRSIIAINIKINLNYDKITVRLACIGNGDPYNKIFNDGCVVELSRIIKVTYIHKIARTKK